MNLTGDYIKQKTRDNQQGKTSEENIAGAWRIKRKKHRNFKNRIMEDKFSGVNNYIKYQQD